MISGFYTSRFPSPMVRLEPGTRRSGRTIMFGHPMNTQGSAQILALTACFSLQHMSGRSRSCFSAFRNRALGSQCACLQLRGQHAKSRTKWQSIGGAIVSWMPCRMHRWFANLRHLTCGKSGRLVRHRNYLYGWLPQLDKVLAIPYIAWNVDKVS